MYEIVYDAMAATGIAIKLDDKVMVDINMNITINQDRQFGRKTKYLLTCPEMLLFIDEVGDNASQKNDGNIGGQKFMVENTQ